MSEQENSAPKSGTFQVSEGEHKSLQGIESWSFDVFQVEDDQLPMLVEKIFRSLNIFNNFPIDMHKFRAFVRAILDTYSRGGCSKAESDGNICCGPGSCVS